MDAIYAIRLTLAARACLDEQHSYMKTARGKEDADAWRKDILRVIGTLATLPKRCVVAKEDALFPDEVVRQLLYHRGHNPAAFRILFTVHEHPDDAPFVRIQFVLHTAQAPLTEWPADSNGFEDDKIEDEDTQE